MAGPTNREVKMKTQSSMMRLVMMAVFLIMSPVAGAQDAPRVTQLTDHVHTVFWGSITGLW